MKWLLLPLMLLMTIFAGCVGGGDDASDKKDKDAPRETIQPSDIAGSEFGVIQGFVIDEDQLPIADAEVGVRELQLTKATDENGLFQFIDVDPGTYTLDAAKLGYEPKAMEIIVEAGQITDVSLKLTVKEIVDDAYSTISSFNGYYECALGAVVWISSCSYPYTAAYLAARDGYCVNPTTCAPPVANLSQYGVPEDIQNNPFRYNFTVEPGAEDVVSEMAWVAASAASTKMLLVMSCGDYDPILDDCAPHYGPPNGVEGISPLRIEWSADLLEETPAWVMARGYLPFGHINTADPASTQPNAQVALNQKFEIWNTIFYNGEAPEGYSIFNASG